MRIYLDMDGVLVDLMAGWMPYLNEVSGKDVKIEDVNMWGIESVYDIPFVVARKPLDEPGFWEGLPPYHGAVNFVETLEEMGHDVYIASTPFPSWVCMWGKRMWVEEHLTFLPPTRLCLIHDKHLLRGDMLVDDKPENLVAFQGLRVLFNQPWNQNLSTGIIEAWFTRVSTYSDILATLGLQY
jgi:5'(3')-deoxyribonucleotidase